MHHRIVQSFGSINSKTNSQFSEFSFGTSKSKKSKPSFSDDDTDDDGSYEVNYKTSVTHKPASSYEYKPTSAPKSKFSSGTKFSSFNHQSSSPGLFKFNDPNGPITTKFAINHPAPTHSASNLGGSYQTYPDDGYTSNSAYLTEKFITDYHTALSKLKQDQPGKQGSLRQPSNKFENVFKSKFSDNNNFKVSSDFKVGGSSIKGENDFFENSHKFQNLKVANPDPSEFKPNFKLRDVPNLYPTDDHFKPSIGFDTGSSISTPNLFESTVDKDELLKLQLAQNPASKGQYQQFLKAQQDEKIEQQALLEQLKFQQQKGLSRPSFSGGSKFRPILPQKHFSYPRRKPTRIVSPGLGHYRTPIIDGPYTIHFSV